MDRAQVLAEALPYIQKIIPKDHVVVIKYGGNAMVYGGTCEQAVINGYYSA